MLRFGKGEFSGYLRPYDPGRVVAELADNHEWLSHDYWEDGELLLPPEERADLVLFADTIDSDSFAFLPGKPEEIFALPRHQTKVLKTGPTFLDLLNWVMNSGVIARPFELRFFQPWNNHASLRFDNQKRVCSLHEMKGIFELFGAADYAVMGTTEESIDVFIRKFGAHLSYLLLDNYDQFIVTFDSDSEAEFLPLLTRALAGEGFRITEHNGIAALPDLS